MMAEVHPWERIFSSDGRVFTEVLPLFHEAAERFSKNDKHTLMDLGCGNGRHVVAFRKLGYDVTGFDISPTGLKLTRDWLREENLGASLVMGDCRSGLPFRTASFDCLISTQVIHHALIAEIRLTLADIFRVLADGGLAIITVAGRKNRNRMYAEIEPGTYLPHAGPEKGLPHHIFSEEELARECRAFKVLEISHRDNGKVLAAWLEKTRVG